MKKLLDFFAHIRHGKFLVPFIVIGVLSVVGVVFATQFSDNVEIAGDLFVSGGQFDLGTGSATTSIYSLNGNLGIGTTSPSEKLEVNGGIKPSGITPATPNAGTLYSGYGRLVLIETKTASNSATIDFTTDIDATYSEYVLAVKNAVPSSDGSANYLRIESGGAWQTTSYAYVTEYMYADGVTTNGLESSSSAAQILIESSTGSDIGEGGSYTIHISDPSNTALKKHIYGKGALINSAGNLIKREFAGAWMGGNGAVTGIRFYFSVGNVESGIFSLYGIADE